MILYNTVLCNKYSKIMCTVYASILWFFHLKEQWNIWCKVCFSGVVVNVFVSVHLIWGVLIDKYWINQLQQWILWIPIKIHPHAMPTCTLSHHFKIFIYFLKLFLSDEAGSCSVTTRPETSWLSAGAAFSPPGLPAWTRCPLYPNMLNLVQYLLPCGCFCDLKSHHLWRKMSNEKGRHPWFRSIFRYWIR